ncbi:MAG: hypothetical protein J6A95_07105 [Clostridia bacterium]|nr:hypothetical protein [Clostridia bacterium]
MNKFIFSDEEISKILLSSPMALPNSPAEYGLKGSNIKLFFYDFIRKLMLLLNERYNLIENDTNVSISDHNASSLAHYDIRKMIEDLITKDTEASKLCEEIIAKIGTDILAHNNDLDAHKQMQYSISEIKSIAQNALNFASGKSKIIPVRDVYEMTTKLDGSLNIGDKFVLSDKNVPDFTLFEKNSVSEDAILISDGTEFIPGESYLYNGYLLVASESGIDTSLFAKQSDFSQLEKTSTQLSNRITNNEIKYEELESSKEPLDLENNTVYIAKEPITDLVLDFNEGIFSLIFEIDASFSNADESHKIELNYDAGELRYVGGAPDFQAGEAWELNIMNGIVASGRVVSE